MIDFMKKFDPERIGIAIHTQRHPDRPALIMDDTLITFRELNSHTNALANSLMQLGVGPGDRISILFHNSPEILKSWSAAGKISVTPIALNYRFKEDELAYIINDSESKILIYGSEFDEVVEAAKPKLTIQSLKYIRCGSPSSPGSLDFDLLIRQSPDTP